MVARAEPDRSAHAPSPASGSCSVPSSSVRPRGLRLQRNWPFRRDIPWYRILQIDVIPGFWNLEIELNSGERLALPCVEHLNDLYHRMEHHRQALDA